MWPFTSEGGKGSPVSRDLRAISTAWWKCLLLWNFNPRCRLYVGHVGSGAGGTGDGHIWEQVKNRKKQLKERKDSSLPAAPPPCARFHGLFQAGLFGDRSADHGELCALALLLLLLLPTAPAHLPFHRLCPGHFCHHCGTVGPVCHPQTPADESRWVGGKCNLTGIWTSSLRGWTPGPQVSVGGPHPGPGLCLVCSEQRGFSELTPPEVSYYFGRTLIGHTYHAGRLAAT